jgi:hypothetical protein
MADLDGIEERQITLLIRGWSNHSWTGYAFGSPGLRDTSIASDDSSSDTDYESSEEFYEDEEDFFITGGCETVINPGNPIWDPRVYFLRSVQYRLAVVVQETEYMVQTLDSVFKEWVSSLQDYSARPM